MQITIVNGFHIRYTDDHKLAYVMDPLGKMKPPFKTCKESTGLYKAKKAVNNEPSYERQSKHRIAV